MHKFFLWAATAGIACVYCDMAAAKTTFLPDWQNAGLDFKGDGESDLNRDEKLCMEQNSQFKYYTSAQCPKYYALDETCDIDVHYLDCNPVRWCLENGYATQSCPADKHLYNQCPNNYPYYSKCVCNSEFRYTSSNCSGQYYVAGRSCTDDGSSPQKYTQCLCSPKSSETGCSCTTSCSDGCGGTRTCCTACPPPPSPPSTSSSGGGGGGGGSSSSGGGSSGSGSSGSGSSGNNCSGSRYATLPGRAAGCGNGGSIQGKYWIVTQTSTSEECRCGSTTKSLSTQPGYACGTVHYDGYMSCDQAVSQTSCPSGTFNVGSCSCC